MIENVYLLDSDNINPFHNQALIEYYFNNIPDDSMIFVLWQNNNSLFLGNDQSPYQQVNLSLLESEHTYLARRMTFGKTLYNDTGVLNYAFLLYLNNYDINKQINVIYQALKKFDLPLYLNKENEICLNDKRVTDNFYLTKNEKCLQIGSVYWDCDKSKRARLLKDPNLRNDIINITESNPLIYYSELKKKILQSLADKYGQIYRIAQEKDVEELVEKYNSFKYIYQTDKPYTLIIKEECSSGTVQLYCDMLKRQIKHVDIYSPNELNQPIYQCFDKLLIDDVLFRKRLTNIEEKYYDDLKKIYQKIKKECYRI